MPEKIGYPVPSFNQWTYTETNVSIEITFDKNILTDNSEVPLRALYRYKLLEGLPEMYFTNLARTNAQTFQTPVALVSLVDKDRVSFPGNYGLTDTQQVPKG